MKVLPLGALLVLLSATVHARPSSAVHSEAVQDDYLREEPGAADVTPTPSLETQSETGTIENGISTPSQLQKKARAEVDSSNHESDESDEADSTSEEDVAAIDLIADELKDDIEALLSEIEVRWGKKGGHGHKKMGHGYKKGHQKKGGHHKKGHKKSHDKCQCTCHHKKKESKKEHEKHEHKHKHDHKHDDKMDDKKEDKKEHKHTHTHKHSKHDGEN